MHGLRMAILVQSKRHGRPTPDTTPCTPACALVSPPPPRRVPSAPGPRPARQPTRPLRRYHDMRAAGRPLAVFSEITACVRVCTLRSVLFSSVLCVHVKTRCIYLHTVRGLRRVDRDDDHDVVRMHARVCHARRAFEDLNNYPGIIN